MASLGEPISGTACDMEKGSCEMETIHGEVKKMVCLEPLLNSARVISVLGE